MNDKITVLRTVSTSILANRLWSIADGGDIVFHTSGTTGRKKSVVHSSHTMRENAWAFNRAMVLDSDTVMYHCLPVHYMAGFLNTILCPLEAGGRVVIAGTFSPITFWQDIRDFGCNAVWLTPTMAKMLIVMNRDGGDVKGIAKGLGRVFCGMAPLDPRTRRDWFDAFGVPLQCSYGTSELLLISAQTRAEAYERHDCGYAIPEVVADSDANGAITIETPFACLEKGGAVYRSEDNTYQTGDSGLVTDGYITINGRIKDIIKRGGVSVDPCVIEDVARQVDGVADAAAVGCEHDMYGEDVHLFVEALHCPDLESQVREALGDAPYPDKFYLVDALPRTDTGKVIKSELRRMVKSYNR